MPISFNPEAYKNTFAGEIVYSKLLPAQGDTTREVWNIHIDMLKQVNGEWVKTQTDKQCGVNNCQDMYWHRHNFLYENPRPNSPIAQFIFALKEKGGMVLTEATELEGKRFQFEEVEVKAGTNPTTGLKGKDRTYFYVIGPVGFEPTDEPEAVQLLGDSLPFNAPAETAPAAPTNGTQPTGALSDLYQRLAAIADGKTIEQVRLEAKSDQGMFDNKAFWITVLNGSAIKTLVESNPPVLVLDETNTYHKV